jgi:hypothetical protein
MMWRGTLALLMTTAIAVPLAGCDKAQTNESGAARKSDAKGWEGTQGTAFVAGGYKPGDKAAWEAQLKARTERGQNEYSHITSAK